MQKGDVISTCAIAVSNAQDGDSGKWTCQISTMDQNNNPATSSADITVTVHGKHILPLYPYEFTYKNYIV